MTHSSTPDLIGQKLLLSFRGFDLPADLPATFQRVRPGGITLFRSLNIQNPAQLRALNTALQNAAREAGLPPLLIAADQEGGQLAAIGDITAFPGNMALGAADSPELAYRVGQALGLELRAVGVNVNYAPVCDVIANAHNPVVGVRAFGGDPIQAGELAASLVRGLQSVGVAAAPKHFPGHGDTTTDSHHEMPVIPHGLERLRQVELVPFQAAFQAGARLAMTAHISLPNVDALPDRPATLSPTILTGLLRGELGFDGVIVTDALEMHAIQQGYGLGLETLAAVNAGVDLLLLNSDPNAQNIVHNSLTLAARRGLLPMDTLRASVRRIAALKEWLGTYDEMPSLDVVNSPEHRALALEVARRAITLVRDRAGILPLQLNLNARVGIFLPRPEDLTPADTSSYLIPDLAAEVRKFHPHAEQTLIPINPTDEDLAAYRAQAQTYDLLIVATINAGVYPGQAALVNAFASLDQPLVTLALRNPTDLYAFPDIPTYLCTYSIQPPAIQAVVEALFGKIPLSGKLPVSMADIL